MPIYDRELEFEKLRDSRRQNFINSLNSFAEFMQEKKRSEATIPFIQAQTQNMQASGLMNMMKARAMQDMMTGGSNVPGMMKTKKDILGNTYLTPEYMEYQKNLDQQRSDRISDRYKEQKDYAKQIQGEAPLSADGAGRYAFSKETVRNADKIKKLIFPDGTKESFNQDLLNKLIVGKYTKDKDVQNLKRWILSSLVGRGLIQSGTVLKDSEWGRLDETYGIDLFSSPDSAMNSINEMVDFNKDFMKLVRPGLAEKDFGGDNQYEYKTVNGKTYRRKKVSNE